MNVVARRLFPLMQVFRFRATQLDRSPADLFFLQWLSFSGLMVFAAYLLWRANIWGILVAADPTGITLMIIAVFLFATVWVGMRGPCLRNAVHLMRGSLRSGHSLRLLLRPPAQPVACKITCRPWCPRVGIMITIMGSLPKCWRNACMDQASRRGGSMAYRSSSACWVK